MTPRPAIAALLLAVSAIGAHALGIDVPYTTFSTPDAVTSVQLCGSWGAKREGEFRVVHAERHAQSFVYVQWMRRDADGNRQATHTLAIDELDNDHADIALGDITCRATPQGIVLTAKADSGHDARIHRVTIEIGRTPGRYTFRAHRMR
jgi:hypothetical protein